MKRRLPALGAGVFGCLLAGAGGVRAEMEPPDYREELLDAATARVEALNRAGQPEEAASLALDLEEELGPWPELTYERALAANAAGQRRTARRAYRRVLEQEPDHAAAWYDLGELLLVEDELEQARRAFERAAELRPDHWAGPFRLAEVAARQRQVASFEEHLESALSRGFSFQLVVGDPRWRRWYHDPELGDVLRRLVTVYGEKGLEEAFSREPPAAR